jgi:hypothetical protein
MMNYRPLSEHFIEDFFKRVNRYREAKLAQITHASRLARVRHLHALACQTAPRGVNVEAQ